MASSFFTLIRHVFIVLIVVFVPAIVRCQDQSQPVPANPEAQAPNSETSAPTPEEDQTPASQGTLILPNEPKQSPPPAPAAEPVTEAAAPAEETYVIKQGDTLWDISNTFLKDPFLWPLVWKANPSIANPDLIYPGNTLVIPALAPIERAMQSPTAAEAGPDVQKSSTTEPEAAEVPFGRMRTMQVPPELEDETKPKNILILPEQGRLPIVDKYSILHAGYVAPDESKDKVIGIVGEEKTGYSYNDTVYLKILSTPKVSEGDLFIVYTALHKVRHPKTKLSFGRLIRVDGIVKIVAAGKGNIYTGRIVYSFDAAITGSKLIPYQEPVLAFDPVSKSKDLEGVVLDVMQDKTVSGQTDYVYLDKGERDGVEPGDRFLIYAHVPSKNYPKNLIAEAQVVLVKEKTATAVLRKSTDIVRRGYAIEYKQ